MHFLKEIGGFFIFDCNYAMKDLQIALVPYRTFNRTFTVVVKIPGPFLRRETLVIYNLEQ